MVKVILADDYDNVRFALSAALRKAGFEVVEAKNGGDRVFEEQIADTDVVVTDILMPDCDGIELITKLRTQSPTLPVIAMSGGGRISGANYLETADALGAKAIFHKPFDTEDLISAIQDAVAA